MGAGTVFYGDVRGVFRGLGLQGSPELPVGVSLFWGLEVASF